MVLDREQVEQRMSDIKECSFNYMILDIENIQHGDDEKQFRHSIEVLNLINTINWANKLYEKVGSNNRIETNILYRVIEANLTNKPFTDKELKAYFTVTVKLESFYETMLKFKEIGIYIPYEAEFVLLGLTQDEHDSLNKIERDNLHEYYGNAYFDARLKKTSIDKFIIKAKEMIENCTKKKLIKCA